MARALTAVMRFIRQEKQHNHFSRCVVMLVGLGGGAAHAQAPSANSPSQPSRGRFNSYDASRYAVSNDAAVLKYDPKTDRFYHVQDIKSKPAHWRAGGDGAYYGSRLDRFRYNGPANRGGIYDGMRAYQEEIHANPKNYQYRIR